MQSGAPGPTSAERIIVGGGEMGQRIRAFDWAATPLGPVERWPQSLRSAISILLPSKAQIILFWGPEFIALYNDAYRPVFGAKHPSALGRAARECWAEVWDVLEPLFTTVMRTGEAFWAKDHPFFIERHGYPEETYFDVSYDPVRDESGNVGGVFCIVSETTGHVLGERRLRILRELGVQVSAKSELDVVTHAAAVLAQNPADVPFAAFYLLDEAGAYARLVDCVGIARHDLVPGEAVDLKTADPCASVMHAAVHAGAASETARETFVTAAPPTASSRVLVVPLLSGSQPIGVLVVGPSRHLEMSGPYRDFMDLLAARISSSIAGVRAYEQERRRAESLAELDRAKTAFFSNVSHEFRTPLTLLLGPLEALLRPDALLHGHEARERIEVAHRNAMRMLRLVNTLLDFSRIESGRAHAVYERTDVGACTAEMASAFRSLIEHAGLRLTVECPAGVAEAFIDRDMWEKVVFNLLSNAFKHTFAGEIRVAVETTGEHVRLTVSDTGTGIAAAELPHVFERFHRVQSARARTNEGTGIGLALVAELVNLHGGTVGVTSKLERGTTFVVTIPTGDAHLPPERISAAGAATSTPLAAAYVEEARRWIPADADTSAMGEAADLEGPAAGRIVLADDNADMRDYVRRLLGEYWSVEAVGDGAAALGAIRDRRPDLVVADVMMPGLDGFQLLDALRSDPRTSTIPVILLSARVGEDARVEGLDAGADDYLIKPFSARELVARVNAHLKMAAARRRFAADLEQERTKLEAVLRQMPAGVIIVDAATGRFTLANQETKRVFGTGIAQQSLSSIPEDRVRRPDGTPYPREQWPVVRCLETGTPVTGEELQLVRANGTVAALSVSAAPITGPDGDVVAAVVVFQDVTDRLALLSREQEARREADAANRAKDRFIAVLAHELRAPLSAIIGWSRILRADTLPARERAHAISVIERNAHRQAEFVKDLLDMSRMAAGRLQLDRIAVDLAAVTRDAIDSVRTDLEAKQLRLVTDLDASTGEVFGDVRRLQQIVVNLLANAVKFTPSEGRIEVRLARHGGMARLTVADSGEGIAPTLLPDVFEPFQQGEDDRATRTRQGLGLGLTIVRELVALHGGSIRAESAGKGLGATFTVELPVVAVRIPGTPEGTGQATEAEAASRGRLHGIRVLVVDDHEDARDLVAQVLALEGAQPLTADSADAALAILEDADIDVIVSDLAMPHVDGYGLIAAVRAMQAATGRVGVRAIALTAFTDKEVAARARAAGFDVHASKPIEPDHLIDLIGQLASGSPATTGGDRQK